MRSRRLLGWLPWLAAVLILGVGWGNNGCADSGEAGFRSKPALVADSEALSSSSVTPHTQVPIKSGVNLLWCATFQLAWNELSTLAGGEVRLQPPEDPMVAILNRRPVGAADLDPASYIAVAGYVRDGIFQRIDRLMREKFHGTAKPRLSPAPQLTQRPQDIVAYCYLFTQLDFPTPFERADTPLSFAGSNVVSFGMQEYKPGHEKMAKGVSILDYQGSDDFIIQLRTKDPVDHLILAKVTPEPTLARTIEQVMRRIGNTTPVSALPSDILAVPKMNFDITRHYREVLGKRVIATGPAMPADAMILAADQNIRFLMDEKGVQLQSESSISIGCSAEEHPQPVHRMVFDKPFLLLLSREGSKSPYFGLWIANAELLVKADQ